MLVVHAEPPKKKAALPAAWKTQRHAVPVGSMLPCATSRIQDPAAMAQPLVMLQCRAAAPAFHAAMLSIPCQCERTLPPDWYCALHTYSRWYFWTQSATAK